MDPVELYHLVHRKPFQRLRVYLKDGRFHDIMHERLVAVGMTYLGIGIPLPFLPDDPLPLCDYFVTVDLTDIDRIEPVTAATPAAK
jgi:hypothetical protein